jgi:hypothetical protein
MNRSGLTGDVSARIAASANQEFYRNAGLAEFLLLSICLRLSETLGDEQGIPTAAFVQIQHGLLATLKTWLASDRSFRDPSCIADTLVAVRDTL